MNERIDTLERINTLQRIDNLEVIDTFERIDIERIDTSTLKGSTAL